MLYGLQPGTVPMAFRGSLARQIQPNVQHGYGPPSVLVALTTHHCGSPGEAPLHDILEHGYAILWHRPDIDDADQDVLDGVAARFERDVLVVPRPALKTPVAATASHRRLLCGDVEDDALGRFVEEYRNQGPEKVPH